MARSRFWSDAPLTPRDCAEFMGMTPEWIRQAILEGVPFHGAVVKLQAERLPSSGRRHLYRIHVDAFRTFLTAIGWTHLPRRRASARE